MQDSSDKQLEFTSSPKVADDDKVRKNTLFLRKYSSLDQEHTYQESPREQATYSHEIDIRALGIAGFEALR